MTQQYGELSRTVSHDPEEEWPTLIEIVAYWSKDGSRKGKRRSIKIPADRFFGRDGAPLSGDALIAMIERLRRMK